MENGEKGTENLFCRDRNFKIDLERPNSPHGSRMPMAAESADFLGSQNSILVTREWVSHIDSTGAYLSRDPCINKTPNVRLTVLTHHANNSNLQALEYTDVVPYPVFLVLCYALRNPRDVPNLLEYRQ